MRKKIFIISFSIFFLFIGYSFAQKKNRNLLPIEQGGKCGYIDKTGKISIYPQFQDCWNFSEGFACVVVNGKTGFIDELGNYLIKPQFNSSYGCYTEFNEGFASISKGGRGKGKLRYGFVNTKGEVKYFPDVTFLSNFREGLAFFKKDGLTGYLDTNLNVAIEPKFKSAGNFHFGRARATDVDGSTYYIDKTGHKISDIEARGEFQDKKAFVVSNGKYGFIDLGGKIIIEPQFEQATHFGEGLAGVRIGDKWGFIDESGKIVIKPQFDSVGVFNEGFVSIEINGKWGFADRTGRIVIEPQFDKWTYWFEDGIAEIRINGKTGYIDKTGNYIWLPSN